MTNRTQAAVSRMLAALSADLYEVGVQVGVAAPQITSAMSPKDILGRIPYFAARNARDAHIFIRPANATRYTLLDDLSLSCVARLQADGFHPCAVVQTSPGNFQAWLKHSTELSKDFATAASRILAQTYSADPSAVGWLRFGRLPGFTNRKSKYMQANGLFPFVRLEQASGIAFPKADEFHETLKSLLRAENRASGRSPSPGHRTLSPHRGKRYSCLDLLRFRGLPEYQGRPAAADLAFAKAALAVGGSETYVKQELAHHYLSSDPNPRKKSQYLERTIRKASSFR